MTVHYGICSYLIDGDIIDIGGSDCQWMCFIWRDGEDAFRAHQVSEFVEKRHQSCVSTTNDINMVLLSSVVTTNGNMMRCLIMIM